MTLTIIVDVYFMIYHVMVLYAQYDQNGHLLTLLWQVIQPPKKQLTKNTIEYNAYLLCDLSRFHIFITLM